MADDPKEPTPGTSPADPAEMPPAQVDGTTPPGPGPAAPAPGKARRWLKRAGLTLLVLAVVAGLVGYFGRWEYAYIPGASRCLNEARPIPGLAYDVWGRDVSAPEADRLRKDPEGRASLSPARGAVAVDEEALRLGRRSFYGETFGNEWFLSDVVGMLDGPVRPVKVAEAIIRLGGRGTTNLQVELAEAAMVGGRAFRKGEMIDTGLDVPGGAFAPLGMKTFWDRGRIRAGITCALCHATVDPQTMKVVHGAPNPDFNAGLMLALASNTAAYFAHADVASLDPFVKDPGRTVTLSDGSKAPLPDPRALEDAVDATLLKWPPGNFDSMIDLEAAPAQLPPAFTRGNHPYSFSGIFAAGPFRGLSAQNNNVHGLNSDGMTNAHAIQAMHGIDRERYLGTLLQNAANPRFRFDPRDVRKPSDAFAAVDPTPGVPGMNHAVVLPTFPDPTLISPVSLLNATPGRPVWQQVNAMSAWQDALAPPPAPTSAPAEVSARGRAVFEKAGCASCHSGPYLTNNRIVPAPEVGTEPTRALAMKKSKPRDPVVFPFDTPVPVPPDAKAIPVPTVALDVGQINLAFAQGDSPGGYKVPSLVGLAWTAPYLHDGGVAVGPDPKEDLGLPGTVMAFRLPDPANSLRALVDRALREKVIAANREADTLRAVHVTGAGHEYWADEAASFSRDDQDALIAYLLTLPPPPR